MKIRIGCCPVLNVSVCSWCGQMFERSRCRGLRVLLLSGKLDLRHRRDAWNLWTLPPHCCDLQHRGGINSLSVHHTIHLSTCLSVCLTCVCVFLSRVKPSWRKVCTASLRESHPRFSRLSAAATSSRGWSLRFVNSRLSITPRCSSLIVTHWVCVFCLVKGARRVLHQPRHLYCGSNQPWCHRRGGAGADSLPQQVRTHTPVSHTAVIIIWEHKETTALVEALWGCTLTYTANTSMLIVKCY